jgi:hypothetical protein
MEPDRTQRQSHESQQKSADLSLKRTHPPAQVTGYTIEKFLGSGAYGEVWVGVDQNTGRQVAIKFYTHRGSVDWSLLSREVEKLVYLSADRYVVQLLDVGWDANPPYYVMDFIENGSLNDRIERDGPMPVKDAVELFREVAIGLVHAHDKGVLHCDLKPANVLLDVDDKPRLADFGQSRLTHEQAPSLGTLFYMAPEQADLNAVPDARWDVYALGSLFFTAAVGEPPYRSDQAIAQLDVSENLRDRLQRYREIIQSSPRPTAHRALPGLDRAMADIIDRCLAASPASRFNNVQEVLNSLRDRDKRQTRRPQLVLGLLGPVLILLVMAIFSWRLYNRAVVRSKEAVTTRARDTNSYAAKAVANRAARDIERYFNSVENVGREAEFQRILVEFIQANETELKSLADPNDNATPLEARDTFLHRSRQSKLQARFDGLLKNPKLPEVASWFVCDHRGVQLAASFASQTAATTIGKNYAWRTYFHNGPDDLAATNSDQFVTYSLPSTGPLKSTRLSSPFQSRATNKWKIAISTPIIKDSADAASDAEFLGIVALTVDLGEFLKSIEGGPTFFASLIDSRDGVRKGMVLQHPMFDGRERLPDRFSEYRVQLSKDASLYTDQMGKDPEGEAYDRVWIVAQSPVLLARRLRDDDSVRAETEQSGLTVLVQEDYEAAIAPIRLLGEQLMREGVVALVVFLLVVIGLWAFVSRVMGEANTASKGGAGGRTSSAPMYDLTTIAKPNDKRAPRGK